jgi:DNA-binding CsgD family transcriptional regulator
LHDRGRPQAGGIEHPAATTFLAPDAWNGIVRALRLSRREAEIAAILLADDNRDGTIAERLAISPHTVHTYLERLYRKLGATSRSQVVTRIFQQYVIYSRQPPPRALTGD